MVKVALAGRLSELLALAADRPRALSGRSARATDDVRGLARSDVGDPTGVSVVLDGRQDRFRLDGFDDGFVPASPGVFALYRDGRRLYAQSAKSLTAQVWRNHATTDHRLQGSALAAAIASHLKLTGWPSSAGLRVVREWLDGCEFAWIERESFSDAHALMAELAAQGTPPLN
ncbi:MAG: hypothetical protein QOH12_1395 [Solirubrobacteraceae bacterium]|nr:hypothetical protein [Solirubrobacteraceae bacterium]